MKFLWALIALALLSGAHAQISFPGEEGGSSPSGPPVKQTDASQNTKTSRDKQLNDPSNPGDAQTRFFLGGGGLGGGFGGLGGDSIFGSIGNTLRGCFACSFTDQRLSNICCMRGERQCCQFVSTFGGFGGPAFVGPPGFAGSGLGSFGGRPGSFGSGQFIGGQGGLGDLNGFGALGPLGGRPFIGGHGFGAGEKFGFCPKPSLIAEVLGLRSLPGESQKDGATEPTTTDKKRVKRQRKEVTGDKTPESNNPQARFFPGFSPEALPNIFCRDECFQDLDCPGNLKCCINSRNCRDCARPIF